MRTLALVAAALTIGSASFALGDEIVHLPLTYLSASQTLPKLQPSAALPEGITSLIANDTNNTLVAEGTPKGLARLKAQIKKLDVQPKQVIVALRITKVTVQPDGSRQSELVSAPTMTTFNKIKVGMRIAGAAAKTGEDSSEFDYVLTPRLQTGKAFVSGKFDVQIGTMKQSGLFSRLLSLDHTTRVLGMTDSSEKSTVEAVTRGQFPKVSKEGYVAYFLDATLSAVPPRVARASR